MNPRALSCLVGVLFGCSSPAAMVDAASIDAPDDAAIDAASDATPDVPIDAPAPPTLVAIAPAIGSVAGGTTVAIAGTGFVTGATITVGGIACIPVTTTATELTCITGDSDFVEGARDVVVMNPSGLAATLVGAFTYECPWLTSTGRRSCGAVPPRASFAPQVAASTVTQFPPGTIQTDGAGTPAMWTRVGLTPVDFTGHMPKLVVRLTNVSRAVTLNLDLGDGNFANRFRFAFHSTQGQRWTTEGDLVAFTMSWSPDNVTVTGTPDRAAITDIQLRVIDDATGAQVTLELDSLGLVAEPATYPSGVLSFTFDDNFASMVSEGLPPLVARGFAATAYVITDLVDVPGRATLAELRALQDVHLWEIAAHSFTTANHAVRFPALTSTVLEDDLVDSRAWLIANRFRGYDHCAYPGGEFTGGTNVLALTVRYFASCRTIFQGERESYLPSDSHKLRVFYVTNATTLARALAAVDNAVAQREWIIFVFHKLATTPTLSTEWRIADYAALVNHVAATGIPVKTIGQVLAN